MSFLDRFNNSKKEDNTENSTADSKQYNRIDETDNLKKSNQSLDTPLEVVYTQEAFELAMNHQEFEAIELFDKALEISSINSSALIGKAVCLHYIGEERESIVYFNKFYEIDPDHENIQTYISMFNQIKEDYFYDELNKIQRLNNTQDQLKQIDNLLELDSKNERLLCNKGFLLSYFPDNHVEAAECFFNSYDFIDKYSSPHMKERAGVILAIHAANLHLNGQNEEALEYIEKSIILYPIAEGYSNKGVILVHLIRFDEAMQCFERALEIDPNHEDAKKYKELLKTMM